MKNSKKQPGETVAGAPVGLSTGNTVVDAISQMSFEGNITDHRWFVSPRLKTKSGLINAIAIHVLADIVFWHRSIIERDPTTNVITKVRKRFDGNELWFDYEYWAPSLGLTSRQLRDAVAFLHAAKIITRRAGFVRLRNGAKTNNVPIITINVEILHEITYGTPSPRRTKRETPHVKTGDPSRQNGTPPPPKRATSTHNSPDSSLKSPQSARRAGSDEGEGNLIDELIDAGVTPRRAKVLATQYADEMRRRLSFLPHVQIKTTPARFLSARPEEQYTEPIALQQKQQAETDEALKAAIVAANHQRQQKEAQRLAASRALDDQLDAHFKSLDAIDRAEIDTLAEDYLKRRRPDGSTTPQGLAIARREVLKKELQIPTEAEHDGSNDSDEESP